MSAVGIRPRSRQPASLAWRLGTILLAWSGVVLADPETPFAARFIAPGTGQGVTSYAVELSIAPERRERYVIPQDCSALQQGLVRGTAYRGTRMDRQLWLKAESDCRFHGFLHRHPLPVPADHVSGYDFMNVNLSELPIAGFCMEPGQQVLTESCAEVAALSLRRRTATADAQHPGDIDRPAGNDCILRDGLLTGSIEIDTAGGLRCTSEPDRATLRLIAVDFADVNGDRILDAILRLVPLGPGALRTPIVVPLTRLEPGGSFLVPPR